MADPKYHELNDTIGRNPTKHYLNEEELRKRADLKRKDYERTKSWIEYDGGIKEYLEIPSKELDLIEHYSSMPEIEIASDVKELWIAQKNKLTDLDHEAKKNQQEYLGLYAQWQDILENMDERKRSELGIENYHTREENAIHGVYKAKLGVRNAKEQLIDAENQVDPFKAMIGFITGSNTDYRKIRNAREGLSEAKRGLRDAKRHLAVVREEKSRAMEGKGKLSVKEANILEKMAESQVKMDAVKEKAKILHLNLVPTQNALHDQYSVIDKYKTIQAFKTSNNYLAAREIMKNQNPDLFKKIEEIPDQLPQSVLKVTLRGPLQLPDNSEKISQLDEQIQELQGKLPAGIDLKDLTTEITMFTLTDSDNIADLESSMSTITDTTSKEYKQLELKRDHLVLQEKVENKKQEIKTLTEEIKNFTGKDKDLQPKLKDLKTKKDHLKILEEELQNDPYSKNLKALKSLSKLVNEKEDLEAQNGLQNIDPTVEELNNSNYILHNNHNRPSPITVSNLYNVIVDKIKNQKNEHIKQIAEKHGREANTQYQQFEDEGR